MASKIRIGIVGATVTPGGSGWGANAHIPALRALPDYEVVAVCTAHEDTAKASAEKFGVAKAYHDIDAMAADPEVDLVVVSVRVPLHRDLVMAGLRAKKPVFCEWPLGANLAEAQKMAEFARAQGVRGVVGLQGRSDPHVRYARDLIAQGEIGEVLTANLSVMSGAALERGAGRIWQNDKRNGANTLTIAGGHGIDAMCTVLGEFAEVSARLATRIKEWKDTDKNVMVPVDSPDSITIAGRMQSGAEVAVQVAAVPFGASGSCLEIYGRNGVIVLQSAGALSGGPNRLYVGKGAEALAEVQPPVEYVPTPEGTPAGPPRNVGGGYARLADVWSTSERFEPDFDLAVTRHRLIDTIERSAASGTSVTF